MYKETVKYLDFNGVEREEDFYFHLTKAEMIKYEASEQGGLEAVLNNMIRTEDSKKILDLFERLIRMAYGVRSADGRHFTKTPEATEQFIASEAYSELFMKFLQDANYASTFVKGITSSIQENTDRKAMASVISIPTN